MSSSRGANKAQKTGTFLQSGGRMRRNDKETRNLRRQLAERLDLLAKFRAKTAPAAGTETEEESP